MKLAALERLLRDRGRAKVFVVTSEFCLCGQVSVYRPVGDGALVDVGASVRVLWGSGDLLEEPFRSGALSLSESTLLTRRLQTHRRHVAERTVPAAYWQRAALL
jgi:hypothetical protein